MIKLFRGYRTPTAHRAGAHGAHIWSIRGPIMPNHLNMPKPEIMGVLLVSSGPRNSYTNFYPDWTKNGWVMSKKPYAHIWVYVPNLIDFGPLIGQISIFFNETNFIWKVRLNYIIWRPNSKISRQIFWRSKSKIAPHSKVEI